MAGEAAVNRCCGAMWCAAIAVWLSGSASPVAGSVKAFSALGANGGTYNWSIYVPSAVDVPRIRGVIFTYPGSGEDYQYQAKVYEWQEAARSLGFALIAGGKNSSLVAASETGVRNSLDSVLSAAAVATGRAELVNAPVISTGFSAGAFMSTENAAEAPDRVIASVSHRGASGLSSDDPSGVSNVFMLFVPGQFDSNLQTKPTVMNTKYEGYRAINGDQGHAAYAMDWGGTHEAYSNQGWAMAWTWIAESIALRYPDQALPSTEAGNPLTLNNIALEEGWLGERQYVNGVYDSSFNFIEVASYNDYTGVKEEASWLPNETVARVYRAFNSYDQGVAGRTQAPRQGPLVIFGDAAPPTSTTSGFKAQLAVWEIGSNIEIQVDPTTFDDAQAIVQMEFYDGDQLLGVRTSDAGDGTWSWSHTLGTRGIHSLTVVATDAQGNQATSFRTVVASPAYQTDAHAFRFETSPGFTTDQYDTLTAATSSTSGSGPTQVALGDDGPGSRFFKNQNLGFGPNESAAMFNAANNESIRVYDSSLLPSGATSFTLEAFVNMTSAANGSSYRTIGGHGVANASDMGWQLIVTGAGDTLGARELVFQTTSDGKGTTPGSVQTLRSGLFLDPGIDYYVAMSFNPLEGGSDGAVFYLMDLTHVGSLQSVSLSHAAGLVWDSSQNLRFGVWWDGLMDEIRLTNRVLTTSQLQIPEPAVAWMVLVGAVLLSRRSAQ